MHNYKVNNNIPLDTKFMFDLKETYPYPSIEFESFDNLNLKKNVINYKSYEL